MISMIHEHENFYHKKYIYTYIYVYEHEKNLKIFICVLEGTSKSYI